MEVIPLLAVLLAVLVLPVLGFRIAARRPTTSLARRIVGPLPADSWRRAHRGGLSVRSGTRVVRLRLFLRLPRTRRASRGTRARGSAAACRGARLSSTSGGITNHGS